MDDDNPYDSLAEETDDHRWAFGTGFVDPLEGVDTSVPEGIEPASLAALCVMLADDALIYSHRLQQWVSRLPELEEETAVANIALDLLGQARLLFARAGAINGLSEDELAFFRNEPDFRNVRLVEAIDGDFAELVGRLLVFATWRLSLFERLSTHDDPVLAAIVAKGLKELAYHRDYAAQWVVRLGDGTDLSKTKMQSALEVIWPLVDELFDSDAERAEFDIVIDTVLATATLERPEAAPLGGVSGHSGREGVHTEAFGYVLAELQSVARAHPDATW